MKGADMAITVAGRRLQPAGMRQAAPMRQQAAHDLQARQRHAVAQDYAVRHARFPVSDGL